MIVWDWRLDWFMRDGAILKKRSGYFALDDKTHTLLRFMKDLINFKPSLKKDKAELIIPISSAPCFHHDHAVGALPAVDNRFSYVFIHFNRFYFGGGNHLQSGVKGLIVP